MREYMLKSHREFLEYQGSVANIREFIASVLSENGDSSALNGNTENKTNNTPTLLSTLRFTYNCCIDALKRFRDAHMNIVHVYIIAQQRMIADGASERGSSGGGDLLRIGTSSESPKTGSQFVEQATGDTCINPSGTSPRGKKKSLAGAAGGKGTGGTDLMKFLRPIRDSVKAAEV